MIEASEQNRDAFVDIEQAAQDIELREEAESLATGKTSTVRMESVAHPGFCHEIPRMRRIGFELLAQLFDKGPYVFWVRVTRIAPDGVQQDAVGQKDIRMMRKIDEQLELNGRQPYLLPTDDDLPGWNVYVKIADVERPALQPSAPVVATGLGYSIMVSLKRGFVTLRNESCITHVMKASPACDTVSLVSHCSRTCRLTVDRNAD